ncbi:hypothetical protein [Streptomyces sp. BH055]|uniref:hypothetical protein n=1 Tax=unclassified Streptomyces TaxID=2593676 RepID=UPI003BB569C7
MADDQSPLAAAPHDPLLVEYDELVCVEAERAGFTVVRARRSSTSAALTDAQEREGRS